MNDTLCCVWLQLDLLISDQCGRDLMILYGCQYCHPASVMVPCRSSCFVVVDQCFAGLAVFSEQWDVFISEFFMSLSNSSGVFKNYLYLFHIVDLS